MAKSSHHWLWLLPVLLILTWIGTRGLNADALWFDEYWSVYNAGGAQYGPLSPADIWTRVADQDPWQAPGYFLALSGWGALVGWTPFALRGLSLLAGLLAAAWAYRLGRDMVSPLGGLGAAVTMAGSAYFLYYFHEMRTYTLVVMLITMTVWACWRVKNSGERWAGAALFMGALGLLYTHYFAALTLGVLGLYHLLFVRKDGRWLRVVLLLGAAGLLFLPWLGVLVSGLNSAAEDRLRQANAWTPRQAVSGVLFMFSNGGVVLALMLGGMSLIIPQPLPASPTSGEGKEREGLRPSPTDSGLAPLLRRFLYTRNITVFAWAWLLGMLGLLLAVNARYGVILEVRYLFPLWPALALVAALGVHHLAQRGGQSVVILILGLWLAAGVWNSVDADSANTLSNPHWHQPWNTLVEAIQPRAQEGDALLYLLPDWTWPSYHQLVFDHYLYGLPVRGTLLQRPENVGAEAFQQYEIEASVDADRVWLAYTTNQPTSYWNTAQNILIRSGYLNCATYDQMSELGLLLYGREPDGFNAVSFGEGEPEQQVRLTGFSQDWVDANTLNITAFWQPGSEVPPYTYSIGIHVQGADGQVAAQYDYALPAETRACYSVDLSLSGLAAGEYNLYVVVYNWQTGERLTSAAPGGDIDRAWMGQFSIDHP